MIIAIASDHGGFSQKQQLIPFLEHLGHEIIDFGPQTDESVDYPDYGFLVADAVACGNAERGVLICGTGVGMALTANKVKGIRAANVTSPEFATLSRQHNDANIVSLSGRYVELETNQKILEAFLKATFMGGRHERRVEKIMALED